MARGLARPFSKLVAAVTPAKYGHLDSHPGTAPNENKSVCREQKRISQHLSDSSKEIEQRRLKHLSQTLNLK